MASILITGGSGLIGSRLSQLLLERNHQVSHLSRTPSSDPKIPTYLWDTSKGEIDSQSLQADAIIHLAGAGIANKRWTSSRKKVILESRLASTKTLFEGLKKTGRKSGVVVSASAIGFYGDRGEEWVDESSKPGKGFLAETCKVWENETQRVSELGFRSAAVRIGIVLSANGGALEKMLPSYKFGVGAYFGNGKQYVSWIHIDDLCRIFIKAVEDPNMTGIYNGVAPEPVTSKVLAGKIGEAKSGNAIIMPAPAFGLKLALGEMADMVLTGARVSADKILKSGFEFRYPDLVQAIKDVLKREV